MPIINRTTLTSSLFVVASFVCAGSGEAGLRRVAVVGVPAPGVAVVGVPGGMVAAPAVVPLPVGSFAEVRDYPPMGLPYRAAYRVVGPVMVPIPPQAVPYVVRYGAGDVVGPRGRAAVISPYPLIPVTTPSQPYGVGVVPPGQVAAYQSPGGFMYRANYQSAVMQGGAPVPQPLPVEADAMEVVPAEVVPSGSPEMLLESIPVPAAEMGPEF